MSLNFMKMHGLGNDFVVLDARARPIGLDPGTVQAIADRRTGVGCDQLILIEPPQSPSASAFMRIRNADGTEAGACGNAARCVAGWLMRQAGQTNVVIETRAGLLPAERRPDGSVSVDMGRAGLDWRDIPLAEERDTLHLGIGFGCLEDPVGVSMGNPHAVFMVEDAAAVPIEVLGPRLEHHPLFPDRANIGVCQVVDRQTLRLRVWERGAGLTPACGSGACAALVAATRRGLVEARAVLHLDGGALEVEWRDDGHVIMAGPATHSFSGVLTALPAGVPL